MPQVAIPAVISAASYLVGPGGLATGFYGFSWGLLAANVALGAAVGAIGLIAQNQAKGSKSGDREVNDILVSRAQRNIPVPVILGRGRIPGHYINLGNWWLIEEFGAHDGPTVFVANSVLAFGEGPMISLGNIHVNGSTFEDIGEDVDADDKEKSVYLSLIFKPGTAVQDVDVEYFDNDGEIHYSGSFYDYIDDAFGHGTEQPAFSVTDRQKMTYGNTAIGLFRSIIGSNGPGFADVWGDAIGPDFTLRNSGECDEDDKNEFPNSSFYDSHTEAYYTLLDSSDEAVDNLGMAKFGATGAEREYQPVPDWFDDKAYQGWYLGRHDVLVFRDPSENARFAVGYWGIAADSDEWEKINIHELDGTWKGSHLDELHGILHVLLVVDDEVRLVRWHLLTGRVESFVTILQAEVGGNPIVVNAFMYSPDLASYVIHTDQELMLLSMSGQSISATTDLIDTATIGLCVSGRLVGVIDYAGLTYWDPLENSVLEWSESLDTYIERTGSGPTHASVGGEDGLAPGYLTGLGQAIQNTRTGHVVLTHPTTGARFTMFIPSVRESRRERSAMGSPDGEEWTPFADLPVEDNWWRDWSKRTTTEWERVRLEGNYSLAAALWASCVDVRRDNPEEAFDSARWGGGFKSEHFDLGSFESLHYRCVSADRYVASDTRGFTGTLQVRFSHTCDGSDETQTLEYVGENRWESASGSRLWLNSVGNAWYTTEYGSGDDPTDYDDYFLFVPHWAASGVPFYAAKSNRSSVPPQDGEAWRGKGSCPDDGDRGDVISLIRLPSSSAPDSVYEYVERYKLDYVLDAQVPLSQLCGDVILRACNGWSTIIGGKYTVGITPPGALPVWHLRLDNFIEGQEPSLATGDQDPANKVLVEFANLTDEYRNDHADADDDFAIDVTGRAFNETVSARGVCRFGQAQRLALIMRDQAEIEQTILGATVDFSCWALTPGDVIAVTHPRLGLEEANFQIAELNEDEEGTLRITARKHEPLLVGLRQADAKLPVPPGTGGSPPLEPGTCERAIVSTGNGVVWFNNGAVYPDGDFVVNYVTSAVRVTALAGYAVDGYEIVGLVDDEIVVLANAPGVPEPAGGWGTVSQAISANLGESVSFTTESIMPIGIRGDGSYFPNPKGNTVFELCYQLGAESSMSSSTSESGSVPTPDCDVSGCEDIDMEITSSGSPSVQTGDYELEALETHFHSFIDNGLWSGDILLSCNTIEGQWVLRIYIDGGSFPLPTRYHTWTAPHTTQCPPGSGSFTYIGVTIDMEVQEIEPEPTPPGISF